MPRGGGKTVIGRKRHLLVDTVGQVMAVKAHEADLQDRRGAVLPLRHLPNVIPRVQHGWADARDTGNFAGASETHLGWTLDIVKPPWTGWQGTWALHGGWRCPRASWYRSVAGWSAPSPG